MATRGIEPNSPSDARGKLGSLMAALHPDEEGGQRDLRVISVGDLKKVITSIEDSISELEGQIASNQEEQSALVKESRKLKQEIRELSKKLAKEVSLLTKTAQQI